MVPRLNGPSLNCGLPAKDGVWISGHIKVNIYYVQHTYPGNGNYLITTSIPTRNNPIVNMSNPINTPVDFSAYLIISSFFGVNNSPDFSSLPIDTGVLYQPFQYTMGCTDPIDGDSLAFTMIPCLNTTGYFFPPGTSVNPLTGDLLWNSPQPAPQPPYDYPQHYSYAIQVTEYRRISNVYYQIGYCMQDVFVDVLFSVSIPEFENNFISIYPNPSAGVFNLHGSSDIRLLEVVDMQGRVILSSANISSPDYVLDLTGQDDGLYFLRIHTGGGITYKRIVLAR
ncbi:MAG: T9SS type A sorting domain-containing protein [Bacteroidia bacterium]|nr:T9SS type A sorting domain-containing protein [Bacteroidia bacterium]